LVREEEAVREFVATVELQVHACSTSVAFRAGAAMNRSGGSPRWRPTWFRMRTGVFAIYHRAIAPGLAFK
jgi:hypothetical protein